MNMTVEARKFIPQMTLAGVPSKLSSIISFLRHILDVKKLKILSLMLIQMFFKKVIDQYLSICDLLISSCAHNWRRGTILNKIILKTGRSMHFVAHKLEKYSTLKSSRKIRVLIKIKK